MKHFVTLVLTSLLLACIANAQSSELSEEQFNRLVSSASHSTDIVLKFQRFEQFSEALTHLSHVDRVIQKYLWIQELRRASSLNAAQKAWLAEQASSSDYVEGMLPDHPHRKVVLIDISDAAKATIRLTQIKALEMKIDQHWRENQIAFEKWLGRGTVHYQAMLAWLKKANAQKLHSVAHVMRDQGAFDILPDNQVLTLLLGKLSDQALIETLFKRPIDSHTYQFLQQIPAKKSAYEALSVFSEALNHAELASQAILAIATHYSSEYRAQALLEHALSDPKQQWFAVSAMGKIADTQFKANLLKRFEKQQSKLAKAAVAQLRQEEL